MKTMKLTRLQLINLVLCTLLLGILCTGCIGPLKRFSKAQAKVDQTKVAISVNRTVQQDIGRDFTFAANEALKADPAPSKESQVAEDMTGRALLAMGLPPADEAARLRQMVTDLISTNVEVTARGEKALAIKDAALAKSQAQTQELGAKLGQAEERLKAISAQNAELASKWVRLRHIFEWFAAGVVFLIALWLASIILPIFFPELSAGRTALRGVVSAVQQIRNVLPSEHAKTADTILSSAMPPNSRAATMVDKIKTELGL